MDGTVESGMREHRWTLIFQRRVRFNNEDTRFYSSMGSY
jgi:hypothetical protein